MKKAKLEGTLSSFRRKPESIIWPSRPSAAPLDAGFHRHDVLYFASNSRALEKIWFLNFALRNH
jgi:hypothetical protein